MRSRLLVLPLLLLQLTAPRLSAQELKEAATLKGHRSPAHAAALSADGKLLATASAQPATLKVWDVASGQEIATVASDTGSIAPLAFRADGKWLVFGENRSGRDGRYPVKVHDLAAKKEIATFAIPEPSRAVGISSDGQRVAAVGSNVVRLWDRESGKEIASFRRPVQSWLMAFSNDLKTFASPNYQEIDLWDLAAEKERLVLAEHRGKAACVAFSADDRLLASASTRTTEDRRVIGQVKVWDAVTGRERATLDGDFGLVHSLALSPDGRRLALINLRDYQHETDAEFRLLDVATSRVLLAHKGQRRSLAGVWFTRDGRPFVAERLPDHAVRLWEAVAAKTGPR